MASYFIRDFLFHKNDKGKTPFELASASEGMVEALETVHRICFNTSKKQQQDDIEDAATNGSGQTKTTKTTTKDDQFCSSSRYKILIRQNMALLIPILD